MPDIINGLPNAVSEEWGYPYLVTTRYETDYCDCQHCEGHNDRTIELPESEWHWAPKRPIIDMSGLLRLENHSSALTDLLAKLPPRQQAGRIIDWTKDNR